MNVFYADDAILLVKLCVVNFIGRRQRQPRQVDVPLFQRLSPASHTS